jgi:16S rRNA (cytosine1402-N4)-methyltransferase
MGSRHIPVLVEEVVSLLRCSPHQTFVDATLGGGGHALEILRRTEPDGMVIGMEWDEEALRVARETLRPFGNRVTFVRQNFVHLPEVLRSLRIEGVDGILVDLGLSSIQLEDAQRGFSLRSDGPLDMRMDQRLEDTAADWMNRLSQEELSKVLWEYGEERWARKIARAIVEERRKMPIRTTAVLRRIVVRAIPSRFHSRRIDPATKTFQALRITTNRELENLREMLETGWTLLKRGGRMCVISFHSLEDRMVKEAFRNLGRGREGEGDSEAVLRVMTKKPITPSEDERKRNPRSRSAKMRCAERV